ncbi:MAG TPA: NAD(P)-binding protein, partial [Anaerolineaceae bacterium]|nr:NAD(P)-binding protein [Anaerolineaceae bacterium]
MKKKTIVIGSGLGGLATAVRLASRGHEVEIYEKRDQPGGQACVYEMNGFKFDGGPTLITAPFMLDAIWRAAGKNRADAFPLVPLDPYYRVLDGQGRYFDLSGDEERVLAQIEQLSPADRSGYLAYRDFARACFDRGFLEIATRPFLKTIDLLSIAPDLLRPPVRRSVSEQTNQRVQDDFLRRILSLYPLMLGGSP